jgi:hypothetical protein
VLREILFSLRQSTCFWTRGMRPNGAGLFHHGAHGGRSEDHGAATAWGNCERHARFCMARCRYPGICRPPWPSGSSPCALWYRKVPSASRPSSPRISQRSA